jgi:FMN phosphatase YigB (HAD superfamily)
MVFDLSLELDNDDTFEKIKFSILSNLMKDTNRPQTIEKIKFSILSTNRPQSYRDALLAGQSSYKDAFLHIFDYDDTLMLHSCPRSEQNRYFNYIIKRIIELKKLGKKIAMASHNRSAETYLYSENPLLYCLFDKFICDYPRPKDCMINEILKEFECKPEDAIFYDDLQSNINLAKNLGVNTYFVEDKFKGIDFDEIKLRA